MAVPLCVDLDGTLIKTDSLLESILILIKRNPLYIFLMLFWIIKSLACLKFEIAKRVSIDPSILPYSKNFLKYLKEERAKGRELILVTAADKKIAEIIANYLGIFSRVIASDGFNNIRGEKKRKLLCELVGEKKYDYAGNDKSDLKIWSSARHGIVVNANQTLIEKAQQLTTIEKIFFCEKNMFFSFFKAIRIHQYVKNSLIFLPLFTSQMYFQIHFIFNSLIAFIAFCLLASSIYLLNDLLDIEADRNHSTKYKRPFASGDLSIVFGIMTIFAFTTITIFLAMMLNYHFLLILLGYFLLSVAYSFSLKQKLLLDVFVLAILYTSRIIAGIAAINGYYSEWLITFSIFFFLSLALVKRYSELRLSKLESKEKIFGRSYHVDDLNQLNLFGTVSGYISTLVFAFYVSSKQVMSLYHHPQFLWLVCLLLLYWISRIWMLTIRGLINEDPVLFALEDKISLLTVLAIVFIMTMATF